MVEIQKKVKVTLFNDEICEAISQYIENNSCGELILGDCSFNFFVNGKAELKVEVETK